MTNKLSTLTICQDEEQFIVQMLEYIHTYVNPDQIVIVDGGSKDNTLELINNFIEANPTANIELYQNEMPISFSDQRNFALSKCTGEWVLHIDADETYSKNIRELILDIQQNKYEDVNGFLFPTAHLITDEEHMIDGGGDTHIRLFRKTLLTAYVGTIHETPNIEGVILPVDTALKHYSMLKNDAGLLAKGKRWLKWNKQSIDKGIPINGEDHFIKIINKYKDKSLKVPKRWE